MRREDGCQFCSVGRCSTHVPLHCNGDRLASARQLAGRGVGRVVEEEDVEGRWATRMNSWIVWGRRRGRGVAVQLHLFLFVPYCGCSGELYPELSAQRTDEMTYLFFLANVRVPFVFALSKQAKSISLRGEGL